MALSSYDGLKAAIGTWNFNRSGLPTDDIVTLAEARLNRELRLRVMEVEAALVGTVGSRFIALPSDYLDPVALWLELSGVGRLDMTFVDPERMPNWANQVQPQYWTVDGSNLAFEAPVQSAYAFTLRYLQRLALATTAPADGTQANWLLSHWPDAYLAACNVEAALWLEEDDQASRWQARYADAIAQINAKEARSRGLASLRTDLALQPQNTGGSKFNIYRGY